MNSDQNSHLAESLCARLCHELSSPLSTIAGALAMAADDPATATEPLQLARDAASRMMQQLRLLRAAWAGDSGTLDAAALAELATGLPQRVHVELGALHGRFAPPAARVLINMLLLAQEGLPRGGAISLSGEAGGDVLLLISGNQAAWPRGLPLVLTDPGSVPLDDPRGLQAPLTARLALAAGLRLSLLFPGGQSVGPAPLLLTQP